MSNDGLKMAATAASTGGGIYRSIDTGENWAAVVDSQTSWRGIAASNDFTKLAAVVRGGNISISSDSGDTWSEVGAPESVIERQWLSVAVSGDGTKIIASIVNGNAWLSTDSGANWAEKNPSGATAQWQDATISSDGTIVALAAGNGKVWYSPPPHDAYFADADTNSAWRAVALNTDGTKAVAAIDNGKIWKTVLGCGNFTTPDIATPLGGDDTDGDGENYTFACATGYTPSGVATCTDGNFDSPTCDDIDGCATNSGLGGCTSTISVCADVAAPGTGFTCSCASGYEGTPGADGSGCYEATTAAAEDPTTPNAAENPTTPTAAEDPTTPTAAEDPTTPTTAEDPTTPTAAEDPTTPTAEDSTPATTPAAQTATATTPTASTPSVSVVVSSPAYHADPGVCGLEAGGENRRVCEPEVDVSGVTGSTIVYAMGCKTGTAAPTAASGFGPSRHVDCLAPSQATVSQDGEVHLPAIFMDKNVEYDVYFAAADPAVSNILSLDACGCKPFSTSSAANNDYDGGGFPAWGIGLVLVIPCVLFGLWFCVTRNELDHPDAKKTTDVEMAKQS